MVVFWKDSSQKHKGNKIYFSMKMSLDLKNHILYYSNTHIAQE